MAVRTHRTGLIGCRKVVVMNRRDFLMLPFKTAFGMALVKLAAVMPQPVAYRDKVLSLEPVAFWPLDDVPHSMAHDWGEIHINRPDTISIEQVRFLQAMAKDCNLDFSIHTSID